MGFTTFIQIVITDRIVFVPDTRAGVIAHRLEDCEVILRDKIKFAYEQLPAVIQAAVPIVTDNESELMLANGSSVRVSTSLRSATLQILHISEFGKICAKPVPGAEIITGTLPAIELGNLVFIESTAEGAEGEFFRMVQEAQALQQQGQDLSEADYKLHFFAWWQAAEYQLDPRGVIISDKEHEYFDTLEAVIGYRVSMRQRAWYVKKARELGDIENMWQEYPSTPEEAFKVSMEGCYYTRQIAQARMEGRFAEKSRCRPRRSTLLGFGRGRPDRDLVPPASGVGASADWLLRGQRRRPSPFRPLPARQRPCVRQALSAA